MSKFQIGDKVKITGECYSHCFEIGSIGVIVEKVDKITYCVLAVNKYSDISSKVEQYIKVACLEKVE